LKDFDDLLAFLQSCGADRQQIQYLTFEARTSHGLPMMAVAALIAMVRGLVGPCECRESQKGPRC
jgi:hypothetical protein